MASTASNIASTSASNEITEENTNQIQNPTSPKVNGSENGVKPGPKSLPQGSSNKNYSSIFNWGSKKPKIQKSKGKGLKPGGETKKETETEARERVEKEQTKKDEDAQKKKEETKKEIEAISKSISADVYSIGNASKRIKEHDHTYNAVIEKFEDLKKNENAKDLRDLKKVVKMLKQQISSHDKKDDAKEKEALLIQLNSITGLEAKVATAVKSGIMPNLFADLEFEKTLAFQEFKALYNELPPELKLCLLCFSVFPEYVEIKRRVMVYWWIGEGFVPPRKIQPEASSNNQQTNITNLPSDKYTPPCKDKNKDKDFTTEQWANHYFKVLLDMGFIESAEMRPNPKVDSCKMHPFVRVMVNRIAQDAAFFDFDKDGSVNEEFRKSLRACLLNGNNFKTDNDKLLKNLHAVFNVDEEILDFKQDSLSKMKNANVLYLGRWQSSGTHHIEVDDSRILDAKKGNPLDGLRNIKNLKFLSLQGISRIIELPKSIMKLQNLTILDIRACHNLEKIPDNIGRLVNLIRLDMSECPLVNEMPKGISKLTKLQVLSGFVVLESKSKTSCNLIDLKVPDLRKLSIHTGSDHFPKDEDLRALNKFKLLTKLTIGWGRGSASTQKEHRLEKFTTTKKDNNEESKKEGSEEVNLSKEQILKKNEVENTNKLDTGNQDNHQTPKKADALQIREKTENSQETAISDREGSKHDKGKGIPKEKATEIVKTRNLSIQEASTSTARQVNFHPDVAEKDLKKNYNAGSKPDSVVFSSGCFGLLSHGGEPSIVTSPTIMKLPPNKRSAFMRSASNAEKQVYADIAELPRQLTKLDLQGSPGIKLGWLTADKLPNLEKLYIRGGKFSDLGQFQEFYAVPGKSKWEKVKELRLKYLSEVEMDWRELLELFPKLDYLEKVDCPKLSFFPCDEIGVWTKRKTIS